jgi:hypothetical protein
MIYRATMDIDPTDYLDRGTFWITLALINAGLAQTKYRSRVIWFLLSLLLGPFATLFIVVSGSRQPIWDDHKDSTKTLQADDR